jgi:hypothetical protein
MDFSKGISNRMGIEMADYILANDNGPDGMIKAWRGQCINGQVTYVMLQMLKKKYDEVKAKEKK